MKKKECDRFKHDVFKTDYELWTFFLFYFLCKMHIYVLFLLRFLLARWFRSKIKLLGNICAHSGEWKN